MSPITLDVNVVADEDRDDLLETSFRETLGPSQYRRPRKMGGGLAPLARFSERWQESVIPTTADGVGVTYDGLDPFEASLAHWFGTAYRGPGFWRRGG